MGGKQKNAKRTGKAVAVAAADARTEDTPPAITSTTTKLERKSANKAGNKVAFVAADARTEDIPPATTTTTSKVVQKSAKNAGEVVAVAAADAITKDYKSITKGCKESGESGRNRGCGHNRRYFLK
jgi:hypothetical protein